MLLKVKPSSAILYSFVKFILSAGPSLLARLESVLSQLLHYYRTSHLTPHDDKWKESAWKIPRLCWSKSLSDAALVTVWCSGEGGGGRGGGGEGALHLDQYHRQLPNNWKMCLNKYIRTTILFMANMIVWSGRCFPGAIVQLTEKKLLSRSFCSFRIE